MAYSNKFRFFKVRYLNNRWKTYTSLPKNLTAYHSVYVSVSQFRNPHLVDCKYKTIEERIKASGFISSDMWVEVDGEDFDNGLVEAFEEIKKIKAVIDERDNLTFKECLFSGGGYYLNYDVKSPIIEDVIKRFKYYQTLKIIVLNSLIRRGLRPDYGYNSNGSLNSPILNLWGVRRMNNTYNWKRGLICSRINIQKHRVPKCMLKKY